MAETSEVKTSTYTREQICLSEKYKDSRDILNALLVDGKQYTIAKVDEIVKNFKEKPIKEKVNGGKK